MKRNYWPALFISLLLASLVIASMMFMLHRHSPTKLVHAKRMALNSPAMLVVAKRMAMSDAVGRRAGFLICDKNKISLQSWQDGHYLLRVEGNGYNRIQHCDDLAEKRYG